MVFDVNTFQPLPWTFRDEAMDFSQLFYFSYWFGLIEWKHKIQS